MSHKKALFASILFIFLGFTGCASRSGYLVRVPPPPPPSVGYYGVAPGPGYVQVPGYWDWRANNWSWVGPRYVVPPRPRAVWVPPSYARRHRGYYYRRGYWR
jgi:hypothetical protein